MTESVEVGCRSHNHACAGRGREVSESGAVLIEFAFVAMLLFVLVAAAFDYGMAWRSGLAVNEGARTGARVGSAMGQGRNVEPDSSISYVADQMVLSGVKAALESSGTIDSVERVVIFRSADLNGKVPEACKAGGVPPASASCVVIDGDALRVVGWEDDPDAFDPSGCFSAALSKDWCPNIRVNDQHAADHFGIWIRYRQDHYFGVTGSSVSIERQAVMRLEPQVGN